jgi:hypothetical protein
MALKFKTAAGPVNAALAEMDDEKAFVELSPGVDAAGKPATLKSVPVWTSSDPTVVTVEFLGADGVTPVTDGMSGWLKAGNPGATVVTITAEGNVTPGVTPLEVDISCAVAGGDSTGIGVVVNPPVKQ